MTRARNPRLAAFPEIIGAWGWRQEEMSVAKIEQIQLTVRDQAIHCDGCESRIEKMVREMPGVLRVSADHRSQEVAVTADTERTSIPAIREKLAAAGYATE
jgi:copper chaperone